MDTGTIKRLIESPTAFAQISAFRSNYNYEQNVKRNDELSNKLKGLGYLSYPTKGYWESGEEESFFVVGKTGQDEKFIKDILGLGKSYNQDAVIIKTEAGIKLYNTSGNVLQEFTYLRSNRKGSSYTQLENGQTFLWEDKKSIAKKILKSMEE